MAKRIASYTDDELIAEHEKTNEKLALAEDTLVAALAGDKPYRQTWARNTVRSQKQRRYAIRHEMALRGLYHDPRGYYAAPPRGRKTGTWPENTQKTAGSSP